MLDPASGRPNFSRARAFARSKPNRTGQKNRNSTTDAAAPLQPANRQAHGAEPLRGERDRHGGTKPAVHLVGDHLAVLAELALQHRRRRRGKAVGQYVQREYPDHGGSGRRAHRPGERRRSEVAGAIDDQARCDRQGRDGGRDLARIALPAHDGEADGEVIEAEQRHERDHRDGERAEGVRSEQPGKHDSDRERADPGGQVAGEAPSQCARGHPSQRSRISLLLVFSAAPSVLAGHLAGRSRRLTGHP